MLIEIIFDSKESLSSTISLPYSWDEQISMQRSSHSMRNGKNSQLSFIYDRFDGNSSADMLEKNTSDWIRRGKPARKNMYYHCSAFLRLNSRLDLLQAWSHSRSFIFSPTLACSLIVVFSFLIRFFRFFELFHGHCHGLGLFISKRITPRKMLGGWLTEYSQLPL